MIKTNLGKISITNKGEYSAATTYETLDVVSFNGSSYMAKQQTVGNSPENTNYWQLLAAKGDTPVKGVDYFTQADIASIPMPDLSGYALASDVYTKDDVDDMLTALESSALKRIIVQELPSVNISSNAIYMIRNLSAEGQNLYDEFMWNENDGSGRWEFIGNTQVDLTGYATESWVNNQGFLKTHQDISGKANSADLATVATTGDYTDLINTPTIPVMPTLANVATSGSYNDLSNKPSIPTKTSDLTNDSGFLTSFTETDPTVPSWAKASSKPTYTKSEVGLGNVDNVKQYSASNPPPYPVTSVNGQAGAVTISIPTKTSDLTNDSGFVTSANIDLSGYMQKGVDYVTAGQAPSSVLGPYATAEGQNTTASGGWSHAEGISTTASSLSSHAEGGGTTASGSSSHAEGSSTTASGDTSHAEGDFTIANHKSQHVFGEYNIEDLSSASSGQRGNYVEIVGNGTSDARSNARTLDWNGNEVLAGKLTVGTGPTANMDVATKQYVDSAVSGSSGGVTYTAGDGIEISNNEISSIPEVEIFSGSWSNYNTPSQDFISFCNDVKQSYDNNENKLYFIKTVAMGLLQVFYIDTTNKEIEVIDAQGQYIIYSVTLTGTDITNLTIKSGYQYFADHTNYATESYVNRAISEVSGGTTLPEVPEEQGITYALTEIDGEYDWFQLDDWVAAYEQDQQIILGDYTIGLGSGLSLEEDEDEFHLTLDAAGSSGGATYTAGNGIDIDANNVISFDLSDRLWAGTGSYSLCIGNSTSSSPPTATNTTSIAIGYNAKATGAQSIAHGDNSEAKQYDSVALSGGKALDRGSFVVGSGCVAGRGNGYSMSSNPCIALGQTVKVGTTRQVYTGVGIGRSLDVESSDQIVLGHFNVIDNNDKTLFTIANGVDSSNRRNAMIIGNNNNQYNYGDIYINCTDFTTTSSGFTTTNCGGSKVATEAYVDARIPAAPSTDGSYMLKCTVTSGVPTYTWEAVI